MGEKISVALTVYRVADFDTSYQGKGHSRGLYSVDRARVVDLGLRTKVSLIMIRQPQCYGTTGDWENGMPFSMTLNCGTWGATSPIASMPDTGWQ